VRVGLITPIGAGPLFNPGCDQITAGIRYLVRQVDPCAVFVPIEMLRDEPAHWQVAATCDAVILCGNPRFTLSPPSYWECDIWHRLAALQAAGVRVIDGWAGASYGHAPGVPNEEKAAAIASLPRAATYLGIAGTLAARITRDPLMQMIYARAGIASDLLPCSSWWAAREFAIEGATTRTRNAVVVYGMPGHEWAPDAVRQMVEQTGANSLPVDVICSTWADHTWTASVGIPAHCIPDAASLLRVFARSKRVAAMRLHAAIPAASVGCEVAGLSVDSRMDALDLFGLHAVPFDRMGEETLRFLKATEPNEHEVVATLKRALS
jgi:hypothetical protein